MLKKSHWASRVPGQAWTSLVYLAFLFPSATASAQSMGSDPLASGLKGEWVGSGEYEGNRLDLTRDWTLELWDQFLRADMRVTMPNGASFSGLTYWKVVGEDEYQVVWMDAMGRMQPLAVTRDPESGIWASEFLDEYVEGGPEQRRWEFELTGSESYVERLFRQTAEGWEKLTEWSFTRSGS